MSEIKQLKKYKLKHETTKSILTGGKINDLIYLLPKYYDFLNVYYNYTKRFVLVDTPLPKTTNPLTMRMMERFPQMYKRPVDDLVSNLDDMDITYASKGIRDVETHDYHHDVMECGKGQRCGDTADLITYLLKTDKTKLDPLIKPTEMSQVQSMFDSAEIFAKQPFTGKREMFEIVLGYYDHTFYMEYVDRLDIATTNPFDPSFAPNAANLSGWYIYQSWMNLKKFEIIFLTHEEFQILCSFYTQLCMLNSDPNYNKIDKIEKILKQYDFTKIFHTKNFGMSAYARPFSIQKVTVDDSDLFNKCYQICDDYFSKTLFRRLIPKKNRNNQINSQYIKLMVDLIAFSDLNFAQKSNLRQFINAVLLAV